MIKEQLYNEVWTKQSEAIDLIVSMTIRDRVWPTRHFVKLMFLRNTINDTLRSEEL